MKSQDDIEQHIYLIRGLRVMLDLHLAVLYGVETKTLKRAVRRNRDRFPLDFMFQLSAQEFRNLRYQFGTSSWGGMRFPPFAFTEQGVAMLSGVLNSTRAVQANIAIMRAFVRLRQIVSVQKELALKLHALEQKVEVHDSHIRDIFDAIRQLMAPPKEEKPVIGFRKKH